MKPAGLILADTDDPVDGEECRKAADARRQRSEHAKLGEIVAVIGAESIADEAAVATIIRGTSACGWPAPA